MRDVRTAAEAYAALRRRGEIVLRAEQASLVSGVRALAKDDDLRVSQWREPSSRGMSKNQVRNRAISLSLTQDGHTIVAPDAEER